MTEESYQNPYQKLSYSHLSTASITFLYWTKLKNSCTSTFRSYCCERVQGNTRNEIHFSSYTCISA